MLQNDNSPYTLLDVGRPDATRTSEAANDANKVSSKYFTPFNHRMMQSSIDLCQVHNICILIIVFNIVNIR